eukprot:gene3291-2273_t
MLCQFDVLRDVVLIVIIDFCEFRVLGVLWCVDAISVELLEPMVNFYLCVTCGLFYFRLVIDLLLVDCGRLIAFTQVYFLDRILSDCLFGLKGFGFTGISFRRRYLATIWNALFKHAFLLNLWLLLGEIFVTLVTLIGIALFDVLVLINAAFIMRECLAFIMLNWWLVAREYLIIFFDWWVFAFILPGRMCYFHGCYAYVIYDRLRVKFVVLTATFNLIDKLPVYVQGCFVNNVIDLGVARLSFDSEQFASTKFPYKLLFRVLHCVTCLQVQITGLRTLHVLIDIWLMPLSVYIIGVVFSLLWEVFDRLGGKVFTRFGHEHLFGLIRATVAVWALFGLCGQIVIDCSVVGLPCATGLVDGMAAWFVFLGCLYAGSLISLGSGLGVQFGEVVHAHSGGLWFVFQSMRAIHSAMDFTFTGLLFALILVMVLMFSECATLVCELDVPDATDGFLWGLCDDWFRRCVGCSLPVWVATILCVHSWNGGSAFGFGVLSSGVTGFLSATNGCRIVITCLVEIARSSDSLSGKGCGVLDAWALWAVGVCALPEFGGVQWVVIQCVQAAIVLFAGVLWIVYLQFGVCYIALVVVFCLVSGCGVLDVWFLWNAGFACLDMVWNRPWCLAFRGTLARFGCCFGGLVSWWVFRTVIPLYVTPRMTDGFLGIVWVWLREYLQFGDLIVFMVWVCCLDPDYVAREICVIPAGCQEETFFHLNMLASNFLCNLKCGPDFRGCRGRCGMDVGIGIWDLLILLTIKASFELVVDVFVAFGFSNDFRMCWCGMDFLFPAC